MEILLILLQFFGELLLQIFGEILVGVVFRGVARLLGMGSDPIDFLSQTHPIAAAFGYGLLGGLIGGLTLLVFPVSFISAPTLRVINLFFAPVLVGLLMVMLSKRQRSQPIDRRPHYRDKNHNTTEMDRFSYGFIFAFAIALVRLIWAR